MTHVRRSFIVRFVRRWVRFAAVAAVCALLSLGLMASVLPDGMYQNGDLWNFLGGVVEARNALAEGQFPIRVAPNQLDGSRYPVFQFYANLPYTVAGLLLGETGRNPYAAWKWTMFAALMVGSLSICRLAWRWTRSQSAALSAAAVFLSAPYLLTDLYDRGAVAEAIAICLLPAAMLATWTCMTRPGLWRIAICAVAWTALGLSHNITYLYGATFIGLFILSFVRVRRRFVRRIGRLVMAGVLHLMLLAWYVAPQFALMPDLAIATGLTSPISSALLTPLNILLWPICKTPEASTIPRLGLQVGWLVLGGVVLGGVVLGSIAVASLGRQDRNLESGIIGRSSFLKGLALRLIVLWGIAFFLVWSPVDVWPIIPKLFYFVQFTYRLLAFVLVFGALLCAIGMAGMLKGRRVVAVAAAIVVLAAVTQFAYQPNGSYHPRGAHRWINDRPQLGGLGDYLLRPQERPILPEKMDFVSAKVFGESRRTIQRPIFQATVSRPTRVELPVLWYRDMLAVTVDGRRSPYGVSGRNTTVDLQPGQHVISVRFVGLEWANRVSAAGALIVLMLLGWKLGVPLRGRRRA